jgi:hypothetical protein
LFQIENIKKKFIIFLKLLSVFYLELLNYRHPYVPAGSELEIKRINKLNAAAVYSRHMRFDFLPEARVS